MSGARTAVYSLSAAALAELREQERRRRLAGELEVLTRARAQLADRAWSITHAFGTAVEDVPPVPDADRQDADAMQAVVDLTARENERLTTALNAAAVAGRRRVARRELTRVAATARAAAARRRPATGTGSPPGGNGARPVRPPSPEDAVGTDLAELAELVGTLDDRITVPCWVAELAARFPAEGAQQRRMLLLHVEAELTTLNDRLHERDRVDRELQSLRSEAACLGNGGLERLLDRAVSDLAAGRRVDLPRLRSALEAVRHAEERRGQDRKVEATLVRLFTERGYEVLSDLGVYTAGGGLVLRREDAPDYGVGLELDNGRLTVRTVQFDDGTPAAAGDGTARADHDRVCAETEEVLAGLDGTQVRLGPLRREDGDEAVAVPETARVTRPRRTPNVAPGRPATRGRRAPRVMGVPE